MKLNFLGGAGGVTGSKTLFQVGPENYLIDYGLYQGSAARRELNWKAFDVASSISAVFLTHAHIDHSGLLPRLWRDGFRGTIYCTQETQKLCQILLSDSAKIHEEDAAYANKKQYSRHKPALPLYTQKEVEGVMALFKIVDFDQETKISDRLTISFHWGGHILGASFICLKVKNEQDEIKTIVFSGDVGHDRNVLLKQPAVLPKMDLLVLESTYGDRLHARVPAKEVLAIFLNTILKRSGTAVIPSFSVGRTQDVLYLIKVLMDEDRIPSVPVFLDSPLSKKANAIFNECFQDGFVKEEVKEKGSIFPSTFREIDTVEESKNLNNITGPMIIISASGMMDGGRVVHHVKRRIEDPKSGIIIVGYQPEGTKGRLLIDGVEMLRLHKQEFTVKADVFYVNSLSAHGDYLDLIHWLKRSEISPKLVILNHGEEKASKNFKTMIETELELKTTIAKMDESFDLSSILY